MTDRYVLQGKIPVPEPDLFKWARWLEQSERHVADDRVGGVRVSTVFLGLDHSFGGPTPLLFETVVIGGTLNGMEERYETWEQAETGHAKWLKRVTDA